MTRVLLVAGLLWTVRVREMDRRVLRPFDDGSAGNGFRRGWRWALAFIAGAFGGGCETRCGDEERTHD
jgi:hypothetical protein